MLLGVFFLPGCLEQELASYRINNARRLVVGDQAKAWRIEEGDRELLLRRQGTENNFILRNSNQDTTASGKLRLSQTPQGQFTDTLFFDIDKIDPTESFSNFYRMRTLTASFLVMSDETGNLNLTAQ